MVVSQCFNHSNLFDLVFKFDPLPWMFHVKMKLIFVFVWVFSLCVIVSSMNIRVTTCDMMKYTEKCVVRLLCILFIQVLWDFIWC